MRKVMVNMLVADMMETEGRVPHRLTKQKYGLGIIPLFPSLRDPQGRTGYEHFYDDQKCIGFLSWCLKTVQRGTRPSGNKDDLKTEEKGGPLLDRQLCYQEHQLDNDQSVEAISLMNHTSEREVIMQKMKATFEYRQRLVHDPEGYTTIPSVFPCFLDTKGLILQDFTLLFGPETASRLLEMWPTVFKAKVLRLGETLTSTPPLKDYCHLPNRAKKAARHRIPQNGTGIYHPSFYICISYQPRLQEERKSKGSVFHRLLTIW
ncbi:uncharacterized protein LOC122142001 [Cyprinus carpio]|uniref:Uncharacterized protein LOC122142001 n=1 Tax=Cyprinus carpio TaxID=7962 RepID=A0A9R0AR07_CYPCA|nr:uncharacterized protein LOC122142001 [Cyprinus carpio]